MKDHTVVILGASDDVTRYSNRAQKILVERGYRVIPVHPVKELIEGVKVVKSLKDITANVDTLTVYVSPRILETMVDDIIRLNPGRVIFNPGTESEEIINKISNKNIKVIRACSIVLLNTGQF